MQPPVAPVRPPTPWRLVLLAVAFAGIPSALACPNCGGDPAKQAEYDALQALVPTASATHTAVANGPWSATSTWGGSVPGTGARVVIPAGRTVTYDVNSTAALHWLRVDGTLRFRTDITTALSIDTIVVFDSGVWEQGTAAQPVAPSVTSTVTFTDVHAITDTMRFGRGLVTMGRVRIHGAVKTPYVRTSGALAAGATSATLHSAPAGWAAGDLLVVTALRLNSSFLPQDEVRTVASQSGTSLSWNGGGLGHARVVEFAQYGLTPYIVNHTRNVRFTSSVTSTNPADFPRRGHVMFMHNPDVDVRYAAFHQLGRTRKDINVTNAWNQPANPGTNPRGRYAVHFHRTGKDDIGATQGYILGCSVYQPSSWAYVNHDSIVNMDENVAHDAFGAAFITENGGEGGRFLRNLSSTARGRGFIKDGVSFHDLAVSGVGFWMQGGNVVVDGNLAFGSRSAGFSLFQRTGVDLGENKRIYRESLLDFEAAGGRDFVEAADTPLKWFRGNVSVGNYHGIFNVDNEINGIWPTASVLDDHIDLNSGGQHALRIEYYRNFLFRNNRVLRDSSYPAGTWHGTYAYNANHLVDHLYPWPTRALDRWQNITIRGFINGIDNDDGTGGVSEGSPDRIAKHEVLDNSIDFVSTSGGHLFANTGTVLGEALVRTSTSANVMQFPTFFPIAGIHPGPVTVTITRPANAPSNAPIYYVTGTAGWSSPSVESRLRPGQWTLYTGPVTLSSTSKLIAVVVDESVTPNRISRIRNGVYTINASAPVSAAPAFSPNGGTITATTPITLSTGTTRASICFTTDGSDPRTSRTGMIVPSGTTITLPASATLRAFAYRSGHIDSGVSLATFTVATGSPPAAPTGLTATAGNGQVALGWNAVSGATSYTVKRSTTSGGPYTVVQSGITTTSFTNTGLTNGTTFWYVVSATNAIGEGVNSAQVSATPQAPSGGTLTLTPTDDRDTQSDNAAGTNPTFNTSLWNHVYLRFSLGSVGTVSNATLRVYKPGTSSGLTMTAYLGNSDGWTQAGTVPGYGASIGSTTNTSAAGWVDINVTAAVQGQAAGDDVITIVVRTSSGTWTQLSSREGTHPPQLVITP